MIIDFHTHIFPDRLAPRTIAKLEKIGKTRAFTDGTQNGLLASMERSGVDVSVVLPVMTSPEQFETVNRFAAQLNEAYEHKEKRLYSFGGIHPDSPDYKKQLREIQSLGLKGIKLHPDYQNTMFDDIRYMRILDYASQLGLVTVTHAGEDIGFPFDVHCTMESIQRVLDEVRPQKLVLAHCGGFRSWEYVEEWIAGRDVYLDTAFTFDFIQKETFLGIVDRHGADKILFATDSPWSGQAESLEYLENLHLNKEDFENILGKNAQKLLGEGGF